MDRIFWIQDTAELSIIHPFDALSDGAFVLLGEGDKAFVGNENSFDIYIYCGFVATNDDHNPPFVYCGPYIENEGYTIWRSLSFAYSYQSIELDLARGNEQCYSSDGDSEASICNFITDILERKDFVVFGSVDSVQDIYNDNFIYSKLSTEADWYVAPTGVTPVFTADNFRPSGTFEGGEGDLILQLQIVDSLCYGSGIHAIPSLRGDRYRFGYFSYYDNGTDYSFYINHRELNTSKLSWVGSTSSLLLSRTATSPNSTGIGKGGHNDEIYAAGIPYYQGAKPDQGCVFALQVNADFSLTELAVIDAPVPARYGMFGRFVAVINVDDDVYGEDVHIAVSDVSEEIWFFSKAQSWALVQTLSFDRDDTIINLSGRDNFFAFQQWDDSAATRIMRGYSYNGSSWVYAWDDASFNTYYNSSVLVLDGGRTIINYSGLRLKDSSGNDLDTYTPVNQPQDFGFNMIGHDENILVYCPTPDVVERVFCDLSTNTFTDNCKTVTGYPLCNTAFFDDNDDKIFWCYNHSSSFLYKPPIVFTCDQGLFSIYSKTAAARLAITAAVEFFSGLFLGSGDTSGSITIAWMISTDDQVTWKTYNGSSWVSATPITVGQGYSTFQAGMEDLSVAQLDTIDVCLQINVTGIHQEDDVWVSGINIKTQEGNSTKTMEALSPNYYLNSLLHSSGYFLHGYDFILKIGFFDTLT